MESSSECGKNKLQNLRLMGDRLSGKAQKAVFCLICCAQSYSCGAPNNSAECSTLCPEF